MKLHKREKDKHGEQGFTLLETIIAVLVMIPMMLTITTLASIVIMYSRGAKTRAEVSAVAQARMEGFRNSIFTDPTLVATDAGGVSEIVNGQNGRRYQVITTITDTTPTMKIITLQVIPQTTENALMAQPVLFVTMRAATSFGDNFSQQ